MLTHKQLRERALARADVRAEFDQQFDEFALLDEFLRVRAEQGLTQAQVAQKIGTTQSAVARMESGRGKHSPSLATLSRYADALGCRLEVRLVAAPKRAPFPDVTALANQSKPSLKGKRGSFVADWRAKAERL